MQIKSSFLKFKNNKYGKLFLNLFLLFVLLIVLDYGIGKILKKLYFSQDSGQLYRTTYSLEKTSQDLLIFGSSAASHNYSSKLFRNRLNMSTYNVGRDGTSIFYSYAVLKSVLKRYSPKMIILNFDLEELKKKKASYDRLSSLLPYYNTHPEIRPIVEMNNPYLKLKLWSKIYPYNSMLFSIIAGNLEFNKKRMQVYNGYLPLTKVWDEEIDFTSYADSVLDSNKIRVYEAFINNCIAAKVKLYIVSSPFFGTATNSSNSVLLGKEIAKNYQIKYYDFSRDSVMLRELFFADKSHLNYLGSEKFSNRIIDSILDDKRKGISMNESR